MKKILKRAHEVIEAGVEAWRQRQKEYPEEVADLY